MHVTYPYQSSNYPPPGEFEGVVREDQPACRKTHTALVELIYERVHLCSRPKYSELC
jgi:hypothetical protein